MAPKLAKRPTKLKSGSHKDERRSMRPLLLFAAKTFVVSLIFFLAYMA
jgi:hypothetical protein